MRWSIVSVFLSLSIAHSLVLLDQSSDSPAADIYGVPSPTFKCPAPPTPISRVRRRLRNNKARARRAPAPGNAKPTPEPTGDSSSSTTVHITSEQDFALLLPARQDELVSDAESDGKAFCTPSSTDASCTQHMQDGFIRAAAVSHADDGSYVQVTGCIDPTHSMLSPTDDGGQFDVRFPNGAQCTFGGYAASFIEQIEPSANRFCLRCCRSQDDQTNCNSHQDTAGCLVAIPGTYDFPSIGVSCE